MRVLVATTAGAGHLGPLVPFASALSAGGHEVVVAAPASFAGPVERAGFVHRAFADAPEDELGAIFATLPGKSNDEANGTVIRDVFARVDARAALPGMRAVVEEWQPDLILREATEFASYLVAEAAGIPHVQVCISLTRFEERFLPLVEEPLTELGSVLGLAGLQAAPQLSLLPASFDDGGAARPRRFRYPAVPTAGGDPLPDWWPGSSDPLVYVTFGTVAAGMGLFPGFYGAVMGAVAALPVRVLLTVGDAGDPDELGPLPANVHVERWWPQHQVMPHAAAMVGHGGFGTTLGGLAAGVPSVVVPLFADQPANAAQVAAIGAGIALDGGPAAIGGLAAAMSRVLDEESFRAAARRVAEEIRRPPTRGRCGAAAGDSRSQLNRVAGPVRARYHGGAEVSL